MRSFRYDWVEQNIIYKTVRSSGLLVSTGTGSYAFLLSASKIPDPRIRFVQEDLGQTSDNNDFFKDFRKKQNLINCFDPQSRKLFFMHREILSDHAYIDPLRHEGFETDLRFVNQDQDAVVYYDSRPIELKFKTEYLIRVAAKHRALSCLVLDNGINPLDAIANRRDKI